MEALENTRKRARRSRGKGLRTTSGCLTCRKRHKKCDERQPTCGPCSVSSRDCSYHGAYSSDQHHAVRLVAVRSTLPVAEPGPMEIDDIAETQEQSRRSQLLAESSVTVRLNPEQSATPTSAFVLADLRRITSDAGQAGSQVSHVRVLDDNCQGQHVYSPDTVASELLTADLASTRWLDLLAFDAAQADKGFSLAPTRHPSPAEEINDVHNAYLITPVAVQPQGPASPRPATGEHGFLGSSQERGGAKSACHAWQLQDDIELEHREALLFRNFAERAALWMDLCDPQKHFSSYATRLALRNVGLMKAILALTSRHAIAAAQHEGVDTNTPIQYYYETLHYVQECLQHTSYTRSEELLATVIIISTYEMLDDSSSNWKRHLRGVFWIQRSQNVHGASGGLRQAVWWTWLRQDLWAAFRERRACFSFWKPVADLADLTQDQLANRAIYLLSQAVNYCALSASSPTSNQDLDLSGEALMTALELWHSFLGPNYQPFPCAQVSNLPFKPLWIHPPHYAVALQVFNFAKIIVILHRPAVAGFQGYLQTQRALSDAVDAIAGIAMELKDEGSQILSAQCLFGAGLCTHDPLKRDAIISLIKICETRTGWPMPALTGDLQAEWAKYR